MVKLLAHSVLVLLLSLMPNSESHQSSLYPELKLSLPEVVITEKKIVHTRSFRCKEFLGFKLEQALDVRVQNDLKVALSEYSGPEIVISSLRRHNNNRSKHNIGKAVDIRFDNKVIEWLVSEEGTAWRTKFGVTFYIEDKPGRRSLVPYKNNPIYSKYVLENRYATGDHIHINI